MTASAGDVKAQSVRLGDVLLLGPAMVWAGMELRRGRQRPGLGLLMVGAGVGTVLYNWANYQEVERRRAAAGNRR